MLAGMPGARLLHRLPTTGCSNALTAACHTQPYHVPIHTHTHTHTHTHPPPQAAEHQASVARLEREAADARKAADQLREVNKRMMSALQMSKEGGATAIRCARGRAACAAQGALRALWAGASGLAPSLGGYAQGPAAHRSAGQAARLFKECFESKARPSAGCEVCTGLHGRSSAAGDAAEGVPVGGRHPTRSLSGRGLECVLMGVCVGVEFLLGIGVLLGVEVYAGRGTCALGFTQLPRATLPAGSAMMRWRSGTAPWRSCRSTRRRCAMANG